MSRTVLIDYGCHSFTYRLATYLADLGYPIRYFANGSLESPNLKSLPDWVALRPNIIKSITCGRPYGKMGLAGRLRGELEWSHHCIKALEDEPPSAVIVSTVPLLVVTRIQKWAERRGIPLIYWLQDLQGRAIHDLLGRKFGMPGRVLGSFAYLWEQHILDKSRMIITIADGHEQELPPIVRRDHRYSLLENWANIEEFPQFERRNAWSIANGLDQTLNIMYSGTLGLKHDLSTFITLASSLLANTQVRVVVVSNGQAADVLRLQAKNAGLSNLLVIPFQPHSEVPKLLASAAVFIAPLDASAGSFCIPSKVLSYFCAARPTVIAIDSENPAAKTIRRIGAGAVIEPGDAGGFLSAITKFLDDPDARQTAGRNARNYAEQNFGIDQVTQKFLDILRLSNTPLHNGSPITDSLRPKSAAAVL